MKSTVRAGVKGGKYIVVMDEKIDYLRRKIWSTIFKEKGTLSDCDISLVLGIVQYELIHHSDEKNIEIMEVNKITGDFDEVRN